jgi:hypothetical protein
MAGIDFGAMTRNELKAHVVGLVGDSRASAAQSTVAFLVDAAKREADRLDREALEAGGWIPTQDEEELPAESLREQGLEEWKIHCS